MKAIYFDCKYGVSGDMVLTALLELAVQSGVCASKEEIMHETEKLHVHAPESHHHEHHDHHHNHDHEHHHQAHNYNYREIKHMFEAGDFPAAAAEIALNIYAVIAKAEAKVHGTTVEDVHFHEVGRMEAVRNVAGVAVCLSKLEAEQICCSTIYDGKGFIACSHGTIPVPVPAVMAMRENCRLQFATAEVETEMVTPSGLAMLIGMGAVACQEPPEGQLLAEAKAVGARKTVEGACLTVTLVSCENSLDKFAK